MTGATVRDIVAVLEAAYPPRLAADWDAVGLTCGEFDAPVTSVLLAVDPVLSVAHEATALGAQLIITHHPLLLRGVHSVAATDAKGVMLHTLITSRIALFSAHTNADHANPGVSDALATALGIVDLRALVAAEGEAAGAGTGRVGTLSEPVTLEQFAEHVAATLPQTHHGVRVAGDPQQLVRTVAVCGGAGDAFLVDAAGRADVYVTADLRHHRAQDHRADGGCALIDVAHWASEWPWLEQAAGVLREGLRANGGTVSIHVSSQPTDPWTAHLGSIN
jgi:dinuclear metal center YbgI/SA1388 family protein